MEMSLEPYYSDDAVTIYHGDCREIMPRLGRFDLLLTDPPYGIASLWGTEQCRLWDGGNEWDSETLPGLVDLARSKAAKAIIWGGNYYPLPPSRGYLVWDKMQKFSNADSELAWCSWPQTPRTFRYSRGQLATEGKEHPTQKPLPLIAWCLGFAPDAPNVLDPFMGSGTTLVAAKNLGRKAIGIEIEERYCEIAAERCRQEVLVL